MTESKGLKSSLSVVPTSGCVVEMVCFLFLIRMGAGFLPPKTQTPASDPRGPPYMSPLGRASQLCEALKSLKSCVLSTNAIKNNTHTHKSFYKRGSAILFMFPKPVPH